jgi:opacity protein-like surface antigen
MAGVGLGHTEFKETKPRGFDLDVHAIDNSVATAAGVGVEYFITSNVAFGVESKYLYSPGHVIKINGHAETGTLQFASISMGFRVYFAAFGR